MQPLTIVSIALLALSASATSEARNRQTKATSFTTVRLPKTTSSSIATATQPAPSASASASAAARSAPPVRMNAKCYYSNLITHSPGPTSWPIYELQPSTGQLRENLKNVGARNASECCQTCVDDPKCVASAYRPPQMSHQSFGECIHAMTNDLASSVDTRCRPGIDYIAKETVDPNAAWTIQGGLCGTVRFMGYSTLP